MSSSNVQGEESSTSGVWGGGLDPNHFPEYVMQHGSMYTYPEDSAEDIIANSGRRPTYATQNALQPSLTLPSPSTQYVQPNPHEAGLYNPNDSLNSQNFNVGTIVHIRQHILIPSSPPPDLLTALQVVFIQQLDMSPTPIRL
jgi:hypothetical protein